MFSSFSFGAGELEGMKGAYVIVTLRLDFYIGTVECITYQVPVSRGTAGGMNMVSDWELEGGFGEMWLGVKDCWKSDVFRVGEAGHGRWWVDELGWKILMRLV